ncbi:MAG: ThuA domain-containing protein [Verrucomicrobia bacterium]|nr:ThuA domain-containing protein [Verrucomicrobiota bacterium]
MNLSATALAFLAAALSVPALYAAGAQEIPKHREGQIRAAAPAQPQVAPKKPRRVLIWNTPLMEKSPHKDWCIPYGTAAFRLLGEKTGAYTPVISDDLSLFLPENLKRFDAVVLNNSDGRWITPTPAAMEKFKTHAADTNAAEQLLRRSLLDYVAQGGGLVAIHFAIGANNHWPEFRELLGATYDGHPWNEEVGVKIEEPSHPLLAAFGGKNFRLAEEIFQFKEPYSRQKLRILLSLDTKTTNMKVPWVYRKDDDFALAWIKPHGRGRVFYTAIGHRAEHYGNPAILRFYLDGIQFATGDLEAPATPR